MSERGARGDAGQASVELLAAVPALLAAGLIALQLLVAGYTLTLVDGAAEAGAMAAAAGLAPQAAVRDALPGWERDRVDVEQAGGRLTVTVRPPSPLVPVADALASSSSVWVRRPAGG
jgi:pilus assembly protein CpaE